MVQGLSKDLFGFLASAPEGLNHDQAELYGEIQARSCNAFQGPFLGLGSGC